MTEQLREVPEGAAEAAVTAEDIAASRAPIRIPLSFVIIAFNEASRIGATIRSITTLAGLPDFEIVVVDDGSSDATVEVVRQIAETVPQLLLVPLEINRGRGAARAAGVAAASGALVATVDADIILPTDWWLSSEQAIKSYDVVSGTAVPDGDVVYLAERFRLTPKVVAQATTTTGSNALFRRSVFEKVGYDEHLRNGEDVALNHEMAAAGVRPFVVPGLTVQHREDKTFVETSRWLFESGVGAARQFERYRRIRRPDQASALIAALLANVLVSSRQRRRTSLVALLAGLGVTALLHVRGKFHFSSAEGPRYAAAVVTDMALLLSYCAGRIVGHGFVCRRWSR